MWQRKQTWNDFDCGNTQSGLSCSRLLLYTERTLLYGKGQRHSQVTLVNTTGRCGGKGGGNEERLTLRFYGEK